MNSENNKRAKRGLGALLGTEISLDGKKVSVLSVEIEKIKFSRFQPRTVINDEKLDELKEKNSADPLLMLSILNALSVGIASSNLTASAYDSYLSPAFVL